jgi:hypothetical protein
MTIESVHPRLSVRQIVVLVDEPGEKSGTLVLSLAGIPLPWVQLAGANSRVSKVPVSDVMDSRVVSTTDFNAHVAAGLARRHRPVRRRTASGYCLNDGPEGDSTPPVYVRITCNRKENFTGQAG